MRTKLKSAVLTIAFSTICFPAMAAHPLVTDDTGTQDTGNHQLELNTDRFRDNGVRSRVAAVTYTYGVSPSLDLFANLPYGLSNPSGISDVSVGGKWRFWEQDKTSIAIKPELLLPSGKVDRELGTGRAGALTTLLLTHDAEPWTFHANVGFQVNRYRDGPRDEASRRTIWRASVAAAYPVNEKAVLVFDAGAARNPERASRANPAFALVGVIYSPTPDADVDIGVKVGLNSAEMNRQVGAGLTIRF